MQDIVFFKMFISLGKYAWQVYFLVMCNELVMQNLQSPFSETVFSHDSVAQLPTMLGASAELPISTSSTTTPKPALRGTRGNYQFQKGEGSSSYSWSKYEMQKCLGLETCNAKSE